MDCDAVPWWDGGDDHAQLLDAICRDAEEAAAATSPLPPPAKKARCAGMDCDPDPWWDDYAQLLDAICRDAEEASAAAATRNPGSTFAHISRLPGALSGTATTHLPLSHATATARACQARDATRVKSVPRGRHARAAREKESKPKPAEEFRRELERVSKQNKDLRNECAQLKKGMKNKDLEIEAKEAEIRALKKANLGLAPASAADVPASAALAAPSLPHSLGESAVPVPPPQPAARMDGYAGPWSVGYVEFLDASRDAEEAAASRNHTIGLLGLTPAPTASRGSYSSTGSTSCRGDGL